MNRGKNHNLAKKRERRRVRCVQPDRNTSHVVVDVSRVRAAPIGASGRGTGGRSGRVSGPVSAERCRWRGELG